LSKDLSAFFSFFFSWAASSFKLLL
jgi:hypothetical protein